MSPLRTTKTKLNANLFLIKKSMSPEEESFGEYSKYQVNSDEDTFLIRYNFVPNDCKILNVFCTQENTILLSSLLKNQNYLNIFFN